ncbi:MAG: DUF3857 domain-containing protein [Flavobacteriales bacterium]|nr:DUF3857 domain-containing protein [Flavobacteriales bacterium]
MLIRKSVIFTCLLLLSNILLAQSGMDALRNNDFLEARRLFNEKLEKDSLHFESLTGMIILSEITQEYRQFDKLMNRLLRNHKDLHTFALFNFLYDGDFKSIEKLNYPDWVTLKYKISEAIDWGEKQRDNEKLNAKYNAIIPKVKWSYIGPFDNINGSGFVVENEIEKEPFNPSKVYKNKEGTRLQWFNPLYTAGTGRVVFSHHLPRNSYGSDATYYVNSFITLDKDQTIKLHIGRTSPVKIWINDKLVFSNDHCTPFYYDLETLTLNLSKGTHRFLVKNATNKNNDESYGPLSFWDGNNYEHDMLSLRFTDSQGIALSSIQSSFSGNVNTGKPDDRQINMVSHSLVKHFTDQSLSNDNIWFDYCLMKAFISENHIKEGEEFFSKKYADHKDLVFYNYLFAKMCQFNGKSEKVYELLSKLDEDKTPIFGMMYKKLQDINLDSEPEKFLRSVTRLSVISPSNLNVMYAFISYYDKTGKINQKDSFIKVCIEKYPEYEEDLEENLSNYKEKNERYGPEEILKTQKASIKALKTGSSDYDFDNAIEYYKDKKKKAKVMQLYRDKIYFSPHMAGNYTDYAEYLKEIENFKEAREILKTSLLVKAHQSYAYELLGDIERIEGNQKEALAYYQTGLSLGSGGSRFGYGNSLAEKVEQLIGNRNLKKIFKTNTFEETLNDENWYETADGEDALVLQYTKDAVLDTSYKVYMYQTLMIKILKESGIEKYKEFDMSFMGSINSAKVIKENGAEYDPEKSGGYVVFKNLEVGDLIQVESQDEMTAQTYFGQDYYHQHFIFFPDPVFYSKFDFAVPAGKELLYTSHKMNPKPLIQTDEFGYDHYIWQDQNLEKIQDETAFPDYYDYYRSVTVGTIRNWEVVNNWYDQITYKKNEITYEIRNILDTLIKPSMTKEEMVQAMYNYITTKIRYSYVAFLNSRFVPKWPGNTCSAGIGDCKDVATLMITMLRSKGIEAYYALVKTNQYNRLKTVPSLAFDHVIVCYILDGKKHYCDLTTNFFPITVLPEMDNNAMALLIKNGEKDVFYLPNDMLDESKTKAEYTIDVELTTDRDLKINAKAEYSGTAGGNLREQIFRTPPNKYSDFMSQYFGQDVFENAQYKTVEFENLTNYSDPLKVKYQVNVKGFADKVSGLYILRMPYLEAIKKSQVVLENHRTNRVDLEKMLNVYPCEQVINLKIPAGYRLAETPQNMEHKSKFSHYTVKFQKTSTGLKIIKHQVFYKNIIEIEDFEDFRKDYLELLDMDKFKIALIK